MDNISAKSDYPPNYKLTTKLLVGNYSPHGNLYLSNMCAIMFPEPRDNMITTLRHRSYTYFLISKMPR